MKKIKSFYELDILCSSRGYSSQLREITELCRGELLETKRTTKIAQEHIVWWWNHMRVKPLINQHRFSYILLGLLRKEIKKEKR